MSRWLICMAMSAIFASSDARCQQSLQGLETSRQFEQAMRAVDAIKHRKKLQCALSTANAPVCGCLAQQLPVDTYPRSYVAIVARDKDGAEYGQLSATDKAIVDRCIIDGQ
jgi:hypothetical protein